MIPLDRSRRSFLKSFVALAAATPLAAGLARTQSKEGAGPLLVYVDTFSSPLRDVLLTQVDLPPGNGRGIHLFRVDRGSYPRSFALDPTGAFLYCCNQRGDNVTSFRVDRKAGGLGFTGH
jgi:hypothetical protein